MSAREQKEMVHDLHLQTDLMNEPDFIEFTRIRKRDKDDEDLDSLAMKKLENLYIKYIVNRPKPKTKDPFQKTT